MTKEEIQEKEWYDLTEGEMYYIENKEKRRKALIFYRQIWMYVVEALSEMLNCNLEIKGRITPKNVVSQYREALYLLGISKEEQNEFIRKRLNEWKKK